jgi:hypothetical protein
MCVPVSVVGHTESPVLHDEVCEYDSETNRDCYHAEKVKDHQNDCHFVTYSHLNILSSRYSRSFIKASALVLNGPSTGPSTI